jgi:DNA-binding Xre family transcriptional regulator
MEARFLRQGQQVRQGKVSRSQSKFNLRQGVKFEAAQENALTPVTQEIRDHVDERIRESGLSNFMWSRAHEIPYPTLRKLRENRLKAITKKTLAKLLGRNFKRSRLRFYTKAQLLEAGIHKKPPGQPTEIRKIEGVEHKFCKGLPETHEGMWMPTKDFRVSRSHGRLMLYFCCKRCESYRRGAEQYVSASRYQPFIIEIIRRLGKEEAARRLKMTSAALRNIRVGKTKHIQRKNARKIVLLLNELRDNNVVRHVDSIHHGAYLRGKSEKVPHNAHEFYDHSNGDDEISMRKKDAERVKTRRSKFSPEQREAENKRRKHRKLRHAREETTG